MEFKALLLNEGTKYQEFIWYDHDVRDWVTGSVPELFPDTATFEGIKGFYPNHDFTDITLVTVKLAIMEKN